VTPAERKTALQEEFNRLKERADILDGLLQGRPDMWVNIKTILENAKHIGSIELDKAVAEARQTALAMATIAKTLDALGDVQVEVPAADPLEKMEDELAQRRQGKLA
jgi:hypothetical protein